jgi:hypothetical protein
MILNPPTVRSVDKVREMAERGEGIKATGDRQAFEYVLTNGRGWSFSHAYRRAVGNLCPEKGRPR